MYYNQEMKQHTKKGCNNMRRDLRVKAWFIDKQESISRGYNTYIDAKRDEDGMIIEEDGYVTVFGEVLKESEKAIQVELMTGEVVGSYKGWKCWVPKSVIA